MGIIQLPNLKDYWSKNSITELPFFRKVFCPSFQASYTPGQPVAVEKSVISFKGRVGFLQYLKGKPNPWGIKAFVLADSVSGYMYNLYIYFGRETQLIRPELPHTVRVVLTLVEGLHDKGYDLYVDRFYSLLLILTLLFDLVEGKFC